MTERAAHEPVLVREALEVLAPRPGETAVDLTVGEGGHAARLAEAVSPGGTVVGADLDGASLERAAARLRDAGHAFEPVHASFVAIPRHLARTGRRADVVLGDLGFSSAQMDDPARGFSFRQDGPLDMRYDPTGGETAGELLARLDEAELAELISTLGEDPYARKIARKLVRTRRREPIRSTAQLAALVSEAYGPRARTSRMHPATRTFMALRIAVNEELAALRALLGHVRRGAEDGSSWLSRGARVAIVSFHSLEDRLVKQAFAALAGDGLATRLTKRPVTAGDTEVAANPRARSAKLRAVRLADGPPAGGDGP